MRAEDLDRPSDVKQLYCTRVATWLRDRGFDDIEPELLEMYKCGHFKGDKVYRFLIIDLYNELIQRYPRERVFVCDTVADILGISRRYVQVIYSNYYQANGSA